METRDGDDALFAEVLALLTDADADATPVVETRLSLKPSGSTGSVARRKRAIDSLKAEEAELTEQLATLQHVVFPAAQTHNKAKQRVLVERHKRRRTEGERENLRDAVYQQMRFLRGLQGLLAFDFEAASSMLCRCLHDQKLVSPIEHGTDSTMMSAQDGDDAFLTELLDLLTETDAEAMPLPSAEMKPPLKPSSSTGSVARRKRAIDCLKAEESELMEQLASLQNAVLPAYQAHVEAKQRMLVERYKRRRAEAEHTQLQDAVYQQMSFLRGLHSILACNPDGMGSMRLNLCRHLHNYTRLPRDQSTRWCEYVALSRDERLTAASQLLHQEISFISVSDSFVETEFFQESHAACAITTKSVFAMEDCSVAELMQAVFVAVREIVVQCRRFRCIRASGEIVDASTLSQSNLQYRIASVRRREASDSADFMVESRQLTLYELTRDSAIVLWDYVDEDELHPLVERPDITRQCIGACLIRREQCPDGVERTVYRELSTRRYEYRGCEPASPPPSVQRYLSTMRVSMRSNELLFRDIIAKEVADGRSCRKDGRKIEN